MSRRERRTFTKEFKQQMVDLYQAGKPRMELICEYDLTASALDKWVKQAQSTGSFSEKDNLTPEQNELNALRKRNSQLEMENDILSSPCFAVHSCEETKVASRVAKQATLIFGLKGK